MNVFNFKKTFVVFLLFFSCCIINAVPINPQPGENIWHLMAAVGTEVDQMALMQNNCCIGTFTALSNIESKIDAINITNDCDFSGTYTLLAALSMQALTIESKLDECCYSLNSKIDGIVINNSCDLSGTYTLLNTALLQGYTTQSKVDSLTNIVNADFAGTFTAIAAISSGSCDLSATYTLLNIAIAQEIVTQSKIDLCCATLNSKVDSLTNTVNADFAGTFSAIAAIPAANFTGTYTLLNAAIAQEITTQSKIDLCCSTLSSKIDLLTNITVADFAGTFTAIAAIPAANFSGTYTLLNTAIAQEITTQSKIDLCCSTLSSKIDLLTNITVADFAGTFTAIAAIPATNLTGTYTVLNTILGQEITTQSKVDLCCATLNSKVDSLTNIVNADFAGTFTAIAAIPATNFTGTYTLLNAAIAQEITTQSKVDLCCATLNSKVDSLTNIVNADFAGTFTAIAAIPATNLSGTYTVLNTILGQEVTTQSMLDNCCVSLGAQLNSIEMQLEAFTASNIDALVGTYTTLISLSDVLVSVVDQIDQTAMHISTTLAELETLLESVIGVELTTQSKLDICCSAMSSKIDLLTNITVADFAGTFTAIAAIPAANFTGTYTLINAAIAQEITTQSKIDLCCGTLNSKIDSLTNIVNADFAGTFTAIAAIPATNLSGTYTVLNTILGQEITTQSKVDLCCSTLNSKIDLLTNITVADFAGTFTAIAAIPATNLSGTYTVLNTILGQEVTTQSKIDLCCSTLNSKIDLLTNITVADFAGTFTAIAAIQATNLSGTYTVLNTILGQEITTQSKVDLCCSTLNSKVDRLTNIVIADFAGTFTAIAAIPAANFTGTYTLLNTSIAQAVTTQSKIDLCCSTFNSKIDLLTKITVADFAGTFTAIAAISGGSCDLSGTYTFLEAILDQETTTQSKLDLCCNTLTSAFDSLMSMLCGSTSISQTDFNDDVLLLTSTCGTYCLSECVTGSIIIAGSNISLDLNQYTVKGTVEVSSGSSNVTICNGRISPLAPVSNDDVAQAALTIDSNAFNTSILNCQVACGDSDLSSMVGRDAIHNNGSNTIINNCTVQAGDGGASFDGMLSSGNGGIAISNLGKNVQIKNSTIILSNGGAGTATAYAPGGAFSAQVFPVNVQTNVVGTSIPISGTFPQFIVISPDGSTAYISGNGNFMVPVDLTTNTPLSSINISSPQYPAITPDGTTMYVPNISDNTVTPINLATVTLGTPIPVGNTPFQVAITPDQQTAYVTSISDGIVTPIRLSDNTPLTPIPVGSNSYGIVITPDGKTAYVSSSNDGTVTVITLATNATQTITGFGQPQFMAITGDGSTVYVADYTAEALVPIDTATNTRGTAIPNLPGAYNLAITQDGKKAYVTANTGLMPIDLKTGVVGAAILPGQGIFSVAISEQTNQGIGGNGIVQRANYGQLDNLTIRGGTTFGAMPGSGIVVTSGSSSNSIAHCSVANAQNGLLLDNASAVNVTHCNVQSCANSGFNLIDSLNILIQNCISQSNANIGFDGSLTGSCCIIENCTSLGNTSTGFAGNANVSFLNNIAKCNMPNFDDFSASSAESGMLDSKIDALINIVNADFAGTFTAIAAISGGSCDLLGTYTVLGTILAQEITTQSKIDLCCSTLNSKIDSLTNIVNADFAGTFTAIAAISATDLNGTYTVLNTILGEEITTQSKIDLCCATLNSKIDTLASVCAPTPIYGVTTISAAGAYCLSRNFVASSGDAITINANDVVLDLNNKTISGAGANNGVHIMPGFSRVIIKNGLLYSMAQSGLLIDSANQCFVSNCRFVNSSIGLSLYSATDNIIQDNNALLNTYAGYSLVASANNIVKNCNAIDTFSSTGNAYGFISSSGRTNLFENCNAESTQITVTSSTNEAAGFLLTSSEICSKIVDCKVDTTQTPTFGLSIPYGIKLGTAFNGAVSLIQSISPGVAVLSLDWSPDGQYVAAGVGANINIYRLVGQALSLVTNTAIANGVQSIKWSPDGQYVAIGIIGSTNNIQIYQFNGSTLTLLPSTVITRGVSVNSVDWSPNGQYLAVGSNNPADTFQVVTYSFNGTSLASIPGATVAWGNPILSVDWSPNGSYLAICGQDPTANVLGQIYSFNGSTLTGLPGTQFTNRNNQGNSFIWAPNGNYLVLTTNSTSIDTLMDVDNIIVLLFNGTTVTQVASILFIPNNSQAWIANWSSDGQFIAVGGSGTAGQNTAKTYSFSGNNINLISTLPITTFTRGIGWSPNVAFLATGSNLDSGVGLRLFQTQSSGPVNCLLKNNIVNCTSGGNSAGIGISLPSLTSSNIALNNTSYQNDINLVNVGNNPNDDTSMLITIGSKLDLCCQSLSSKIDGLTTLVNTDFAGTFTLLQKTDNDVLTVSSKVDALTNIVNADFNATFTVLAQAFACGATPIYQSNFSNGTLLLANTGTDYCFTQNLAGAIIMSAPQITVDLAMHNLVGTFSVLSSDAIIKNGNILPPVPSSTADLLNAGVFISNGASGALVRDCRIECSATSLTGANGRDAVNNTGSNTIITDCYINAGNGGSGAAGIAAGNGGIGINNTGSKVQIKNSKIQSSNGGNGIFFLYVARGSGIVTPVNLSNNGIGSNITTGGSPTRIAITPNGQTAYVVDGAGSVIPITIATNTVGTAIAVVSPSGIAITPDGTMAYVTTSNSVTPITLATNTAGTPITVGTNPQGIAITPDGTKAYVVNSGSGNVTPITLATNTAGTPITVGTNPQEIAITPDGKTAYVTNLTNGTVTPITIATNTAGTPITVGTNPRGIAITPNGQTAYVVNSSSVIPITVATNTAGTPIAVASSATSIAIRPDGVMAYVGRSGGITPITIATNTAGSNIAVNNAFGLAITPFNGGTAGVGIMQQANFGQIAANVISGGTAGALGGSVGSGIVATANANSNVIDRCTVFNSSNGFNLIGSNDVLMTDCIAQGCVADGFVTTNSAASIAVDHCTAMLNGGSGFNFAAAGNCCSVGNSSAISNTSSGFTGTGSNVLFYSNFANCNGTNFDTNSASSAISGKLDSKVDALATSFNNTFTVLAQGFACGATPIYQSNVVNGSLLLTSTGTNYCLAQNITGTIVISASNVTLDLNSFNLTGLVSITGSTSNSIVSNGSIRPSSPVSTADAAQPAILVNSSSNYALIQNIYINCANSTISGINGRDGIDNLGNNTIIQQCVIQTGTGSDGATSIAGSNGGVGILSTGANLQAIDCTIITGGGGAGGSITTAGATAPSAGNGGNGITVSGANSIISDCMITTGNGNVGGANTATGTTANTNGGAGGNGGNGIFCTGSQAQIMNCSINAGSGGTGGVSSVTGLTGNGGAGGFGGNGIVLNGIGSAATQCYIVGGVGGQGGTTVSAVSGGVGNAGGDGIVLSANVTGIAIKSCIIRTQVGGDMGTTSGSSAIRVGGRGGDGINISSGIVDIISDCDIAGLGTALNRGGNSYNTSVRGGNGITITGGSVNAIANCTINSLGNGGNAAAASGGTITAGSAGSGILVSSNVGSIKNCAIAFLGNGGNVTLAGITNIGGDGGVGIYVTSSVGAIESCIISNTGVGGVATTSSNANTGGAGGTGIVVSGSVGIISNCSIANLGNGGAASGGSTSNTGGAGGFGINSLGSLSCIESCKINSTGTGGAATGNGTTGGIGGDGIRTAGGAIIIKNCTVARTGSGGSGTTAANGGTGVFCAGSGGGNMILNCVVDKTNGINAHGFNLGSIGFGSIENCSAGTVTGSGFIVLSGNSAQTIRNCVVAYCPNTAGFDLTAGGAGTVVEKCLASSCTLGFAGPANSNVAFFLNEATRNGADFNANIIAANGSFTPVSLTTGGNYGANLKT